MNTDNFDGLTCFSVELEVARSPLSEKVNLLVLESDPTPDYFALNNFPPNSKHPKDRHLFLPVKRGGICFQDMIYRQAAKLTEKYGMSIYPGQMTFQNEEHQCIRLNMKDSWDLPGLVGEFSQMGVQFYPDKPVKIYTSLVFYKKYTEFNNTKEGIYVDKNNHYRYFFKLNKHLEFEQFKKGIKQIKNNCNNNLFDSFLVSLFYKGAMLDFVGIYSKHCDMAQFVELKQEIEKQFR
ncbi:MAG: hypothetical protein JXR65_00805 [Bacteroidales bacterium]|nr:hypothetical protein [Bacteroidales bacterium]